MREDILDNLPKKKVSKKTFFNVNTLFYMGVALLLIGYNLMSGTKKEIEVKEGVSIEQDTMK